MIIHHTVGVYPNGSYKQNGVRDDLLEQHVAYNKHWRPGRALFVDGECVHEGIMSHESLNEAIKLVATLPPITKDTSPYV